MAEFGDFIFSVFDHWLQLLGGCVLMVLVALFEKYVLQREVSIKVYTALLCLLVFWACFLAWKDQYELNKQAPDYRAEITTMQKHIGQKDSEIRDLKDFKTTATTELTILRHEKDTLIHDLEGKSNEVQILQNKLRLAETSSLPLVDLATPPILQGEKNGSLILFPLVNAGAAQITVVSTETTVYLGKDEFFEKNTNQFILHPNLRHHPFELPVDIPKITPQEIETGKTPLQVIVKLTMKGAFNEEHIGCLSWEWGEHEKKRRQGRPKECAKSYHGK
ncbi:protein of unknown function [Nitrospira japonica]|uniref:Uncharacterized protein n=1 Tax=Nitrospira japonica TaxID=1325564 RepID=A0A1W1I197_9BACT|nr:hypothetical protein [Nitrospira japonica]SLM46778.1 protein of unknown function [Nitrospira japonica]